MTSEIKNYGVTIGSLTEAERRCVDFSVSSIVDLLNATVDSQVQFGKSAILSGLKDYCFANGLTPAATEDARIAQAFELGLVTTAAQRQAEAAARLAVEAGAL